MSVGIYMPVYNVENYILKSLNSIKNQTFKDWQLVILDDQSTDNTYNVIKTILDTTMYQDERISLHRREEHSGRIGQVKNEALALLGNHDYVCHVGGDDYITNGCLKTYVDFMDSHPEIGVCYGSFKCFNDKGDEWVFPHVSNSGDYNPSTLLQYMCLFHMRFYRKSIVEKVGGYSNELSCAVDYDLALKVDEVTKIHRIKEPYMYYYRQHSQQISMRGRPEQDANAKKALELALVRRGINGKVVGNKPPFRVEHIIGIETADIPNNHFIWGKK